jgi:2-hydroxy-3-keto-5-methylthiopentenyl-1-phosphate phosphatase
MTSDERATPPAGGAVSPLRPGDPPIAILVDYDGTIALTDVGDAIMVAHVPGEWEAFAALYDEGRMGSRRLMEWEVARMPVDPGPLFATAAAQSHDPAFVPFVHRAREAGIPIEVVSDGFGFFIPLALERLGVGDVPVTAATMSWAAGRAPSIAFPNGHPRCFVCGTCKRARVLAHRAAGRAVVFVGDGESDRYAAGYADAIFAKRALVRLCEEAGWPFHPWTTFADIERWLFETIAAWRVDPATPLVPRPTDRPFFCGPEVWGEGRFDPPA